MKKIKAAILLVKVLFSIINLESFKEFRRIRIAKKNGYYENINEIPTYNWFELEKGNLEYLNKKTKIKVVPLFYKRIFYQMQFQFDKINTDFFRKYAEAAYLLSLYYTEKNKKYLNLYERKKNEIEKEFKKDKKNAKLNDITTFIEEIFENVGVIDVHKINAGRFFSLFYRAVEKVEKLKTRQYKK